MHATVGGWARRRRSGQERLIPFHDPCRLRRGSVKRTLLAPPTSFPLLLLEITPFLKSVPVGICSGKEEEEEEKEKEEEEEEKEEEKKEEDSPDCV